jgi:hypothetical protein
MKKFKLSLMMLTAIVVLASCGGQIRLTETESVGKDAVVNSVCENSDIKVTYDMWAENGITYFSIYNKAEKPMYIDWKRSVFVYNDWKNDYWVEKSTTQEYLVPSGTGKAITYSRRMSTVVAERYTFIPPHTYVSVPMSYTIISSAAIATSETNGDNKMAITITDNLKTNPNAQKVKIASTTGKGTVKAFELAYSKETSPYRFRNFLTYAFDEKFATEKFIENEFYVSKHTQMSVKNFLGKKTKAKVSVKSFGKKSKGKVTIYDSPYKKGTSFYKTLIL